MQDDKRRCSSHSAASLEVASRSVCKGMQGRNNAIRKLQHTLAIAGYAFLYFDLVFMHSAPNGRFAACDKSLSVALQLSRTISIHVTHILFLSARWHLLAVSACLQGRACDVLAWLCSTPWSQVFLILLGGLL